MEILTAQELLDRAGSRRTVQRWLREGLWWRVVRGAYAPVGVADDLPTRAAALRRVLPPGTAASHRTVLWLLGLPLLQDRLDLTVERRRHLLDRPGVRISTALLPAHELVEIGGVLATSAARAFADVAREEHLVEAVVVGDALLRAGHATAEQLQAAVDRAAGLRGVVGARLVLPHLEARSESPMESRTRMRLVLSGLPRPEAQCDVYDADGHVGRVDLRLDGVLIEYDGREVRLVKEVFQAERRRQNRLLATGAELLRLTSADYYLRPAAAVKLDVLRALRSASGRDRSGMRTGPDTLPAPRYRPLPTLDLRRAA